MHNIICRVRYAASKSNNDTTSYNKYEHVTARTKKNGHTKSKNKVHWLYIFVYPHWTTCGRAGAYTNPWGPPLGITRAKAAKAPKSHASEGGQMTWFIKVYQGLSGKWSRLSTVQPPKKRALPNGFKSNQVFWVAPKTCKNGRDKWFDGLQGIRMNSNA